MEEEKNEITHRPVTPDPEATPDIPATGETPAPPAEVPAAPTLGFLELMRAPASPPPGAPDATDRVLTRHRRSAWDF